jgi:integrase
MPSVQTRALSNGGTRYFVRIRDPQPASDRKGWTSATFATKNEADQFVRDVEQRGVAWALAEYRRSHLGDAGPTLDTWAKKHFDALTAVTPASVAKYRKIYDRHWSPTLGHMSMATITRTHIATALNQVPGADQTRKNRWGVLTHIFKTAMAEGLIPKSPCVGIKLGRRTEHEATEHRYLTIEEFSAILGALPRHYRPLVLFLGGTGARWGEAAALTVGDIDLEAATVRIVKTVRADPTVPGGKTIGPVKTKKGRRTVTLPARVVDVLRPIMEDRKRTDRLFTGPAGGKLEHSNFYRDAWQKQALPKSKIAAPMPRIHDLRHSHVAWLIAQGVPLPVIQARLGHEKITTTIDTYGHLLPDLQRAAADAADRVLTGITLPSAPKELQR